MTHVTLYRKLNGVRDPNPIGVAELLTTTVAACFSNNLPADATADTLAAVTPSAIERSVVNLRFPAADGSPVSLLELNYDPAVPAIINRFTRVTRKKQALKVAEQMLRGETLDYQDGDPITRPANFIWCSWWTLWCN